MNIINRLTCRHLRQNRGRTLMTITGIVLSVAMVCCVAGFVLSLRDLGINMLIESKGDWHVAYVDVSQETAGQIAGEDIFASYYTEDGDTEGFVNIHLRMEHPKRDVIDVAGAIAQKYGVERWGGNTELLALEGVIPYDNVMITVVSIGAIAILVVVAGSVIVIANSFNISTSERVRQFGLLKSVGATADQLKRSVLFEAFLLTVIAIPFGIGLGFFIQAVVLWLTNGLFAEIFALNNYSLAFRVIFDPLVIYISIAIALITVLVSACLPARRAAKTSAIDAIRQAKDIQIRPKKLGTPRLTQALFGFEGTLAAKSLKRSSGKYRATVVSLTVSIILFVSMSSFIWVMNKGAEMEYGGYDFDVLVAVNADWNRAEEIADALRSIPNSQVKKHPRLLFEAVAPAGFVTENALESMTSENHYGILLHLIPNAEFEKIAGQDAAGVLVNTTGTFHSEDKVKEATPYRCETGTELPLVVGVEEESPQISAHVKISAVLSEIPSEISRALFDGSLINVLVPETAYKDLYQYSDAYTFYTVTAADPEAFCQAAGEMLLAENDGVIIEDVAQMTRLNRNITLVVMLFGYGFIAMLSLIAVTSVVATISTGMALRRQEFAMLFSAGMTAEGMDKMLNLESLLYGFKSLLIGLPAGVVLSLLIHKAMTNTFVFAYSPPVTAMIICVAAVMALTFGTMRYGKRKLNKISIVEAIRNETI